MIKKPTIVQQFDLTTVLFVKGPHELVAEPLRQVNLLLRVTSVCLAYGMST